MSAVSMRRLCDITLNAALGLCNTAEKVIYAHDEWSSACQTALIDFAVWSFTNKSRERTKLIHQTNAREGWS